MSADELAPVWSALANPHRRKLLDQLTEGPRTTGELADEFPQLSRYAVMQHLGVLEQAGLVVPQHEGRYRHNHLNPVPIRQIYQRWIRPFTEQVAEQVLALQTHILTSQETPMGSSADRVIKIEAEVHIAAKPGVIFEAFTTGLDSWWPHRTRQEANIVYEPEVGGRVFEDWGDGCGLLYGQVSVYDPPHRHELVRSGMGAAPFMTQSAEALEPDGDGTRYRKTLVIWGEIAEDTEQMYRQGVPSLTELLKAHVEQLVMPGTT